MFDLLSKNTGSSLRPFLALLLLLVFNAFPAFLPSTEAVFPINLADIPCGKGTLQARSSRIIGGSSLLNRVTVTPRQNCCDRPVPLGRQAPQKDSKLAQGSNSEFVSGSETEFWNSHSHTSQIGSFANFSGPLWRLTHHLKACPYSCPLRHNQATAKKRKIWPWSSTVIRPNTTTPPEEWEVVAGGLTTKERGQVRQVPKILLTRERQRFLQELITK